MADCFVHLSSRHHEGAVEIYTVYIFHIGIPLTQWHTASADSSKADDQNKQAIVL